ncbi:hypothetical protein [Arthrobacter sp. YAF16]|uniref:hypothetical protein n=1 Tax=Arthrobacter sp. YAF16 TaxID=3233076 RepID=UPI003F92CFFD
MSVLQPPTPLSHEQHALLVAATPLSNLQDALNWIAEQRPVAGGITHRLLTALVHAADAAVPGAEAALRAIARQVLHSTLDTSADLVSTKTIVAPHRYQEALAEVVRRTPTSSLSGITPQAVGAAQASNTLVVEALALVAGLSWRDLRDRASARGTSLPGESTGPWQSSQIRCAFAIIDEIVRGQVKPQLAGAVGARPLELLLEGTNSWSAVDALYRDGVSYGTLLAQRDVGSAWSAHRNRTNTEISRLIVVNVLSALSEAGVSYWSVEGPGAVPRSFLAKQAVQSGKKTPGQLSVVTKSPDGRPACAVLVAVARDGGTARKTAATFLSLPESLALPAALVLVGTGWADRSESDKLVRAYGGRIFTEHTLQELAVLAAEMSVISDTIGATKSLEER